MAKTITISFSELDKARQCLFAHELSYKERWQSPTTGPALSRGTLTHSCLELRYRLLKSGMGLDEVNKIVRAEFLQLPSGEQTEEQELVEWMYNGYDELYGSDPQWKIVAIEHAAECWLPTERGGRSRFKLKMKIDLVVRDSLTGALWIVDHKTGKDLPHDKMLDIDDQFGLYTWALRKMGKPVFGSIHNCLRTYRNKDQKKNPQLLQDRFKRTRLSRTDIELDNIALDAYRTAKIAYSLPVGLAPRSPNSDTCRWRCDFTEPCLFGRKGTDHREFLRDAGFTQNYDRH